MTEEQRALLHHAIKKTLVVCGGLVENKSGKALVSVSANEALTERACNLILNQMLKELVFDTTPTDVRVLMAELSSLARES